MRLSIKLIPARIQFPDSFDVRNRNEILPFPISQITKLFYRVDAYFLDETHIALDSAHFRAFKRVKTRLLE